MRKRWEIHEDIALALTGIILAWVSLGWIAGVVIGAHHWNTAATIAISAWGGPILVAALVALGVRVYRWALRDDTYLMRRVVVPVTTDLRERHR